MVEAQDFFKFSNPLFLDAFVAIVLYIVYRLLSKRFPRIAEGIKEASLMFLVFMCYDASRYFALDSAQLAISNAKKVIKFEKAVHIDWEIPIQTLVVSSEGFANFLNRFYLGAHWGGLVIFFVWAYSRVIFASPCHAERRRKEYVTARGRFIIMNMLAVFSFIAYPCAPPRAIVGGGYIDTLLTIGHADVYANTRRFVNPYAAMPSMHQGYSLLFAVTIIIMLRSEIMAYATEREEEDTEAGLMTKPSATRFGAAREYFARMARSYNQYHVLSDDTRRNERKLRLLALIPCALVAYPIFMFLVIVGTGNHFVLDALAGASAFTLAVLIFPLFARAFAWVESTLIRKAASTLTQMSTRILGEKGDIEMGMVKDGEEKKGFLAETA